MKKVRLFAAFLALLVLFSLSGCSASKSASTEAHTYPAENGENVTSDSATSEEMNMAEDGGESVPQATSAEKIIYSADLRLESKEFETATTALERSAAQVGGFIEQSSVEGASSYATDGSVRIIDRYANYTLRIPAEKLDGFLSQAGSIGNVTSLSRSAENVTSQYTDFDARLESLQTEESRVLALMEKADTMESLIQLEDKLSDIRYEIESIQRNLKNLDSKIAYSTVTVYIQEVGSYQRSASATRTFGQKLADALSDGWRGFTRGLQNFCIWFVGNIFGIVIFIAIVAAALLVFRSRRRKKAKKAEETTEE